MESISSDLSSQQLLVNQLKERLQQNESLLKGRESEFAELQQKFNKMKFLQKSKTTAVGKDSPALVANPSTGTGTSTGGTDTTKMSTSSDLSPQHSMANESANRAKILLLKKQLDESRQRIERSETENELMKRELQVLRERQIKFEEEFDDKDVEVISANESTGDEPNVNEMFAQIVYKDTKIMDMNQKICDLETNVLDLKENLKEQNEVLHARNRAIKVLLSQQSTGSTGMNVSFDEVVQREEEKERIEKLKERVCELEMEKGSLQLRLMEVEGTNGSKPPVIDIEFERDSLRAERDELKVKCDELMAKYDSLELQKDKVLTDRERVVNDMKKLKELNNNLCKEKDKYKSDIGQLNQSIVVYKQNYNSLNNEFIAMKGQLSDKDNEIESVRHQLTDLALRSKSLITEKDSEISELKQQLSDKSDSNRFEQNEKLVIELNQSLDKWKNENWNLVNINQEFKSEISQLGQQLKTVRFEYESQKSSLNQIISDKDNSETERQVLIEQFQNDILVLQNENQELRSQLESSASKAFELDIKANDLLSSSEKKYFELNGEIENLKSIYSELEINSSEKVNQFEESTKQLNEQISALLSHKTVLSQELETIKMSLEAEKQQKLETLQLLDRFESEKCAENELIDDKNKQIDRLKQDLEKCETVLNEQICNREQEKTELEAKIRELIELKCNSEENQILLKNKIKSLEEMSKQNEELETKFEEAKVKNQSLANQMENLIKIIETESQEKERLRESLEILQKENFVESDLIRDKELRIESLQKEIRKQLEDMQEIEELLSEKQSEIEILNNDILLVQKDKIELQSQNDELNTKLESIGLETNNEIKALQLQIEDLNEENDSNKNEIQVLTQKLTQELKTANEKFDSKERENMSTIDELRKQLESQEVRLNEAMNELMSKSDENTDTNLLYNEIQVLRETCASLQLQNQLSQTDSQKSVQQLNASVLEYKSLLDESRIQIDRLEAEKLSAVQETNKVNQVLETERENQSQVVAENQLLTQQMTQLNSELESIRSQNQYEYESVQNERINQMNQTIDDLQLKNTELNSSFEKLKQFSDEIQNNSSKQFEELLQKSDNERQELSRRLVDLQNTIDTVSAEKQRFEYGFYDIQRRYQEFDRILQQKNIEIENLKQIENSNKKLAQTLNNLKEEKEHLLRVLSEKEKLFEEQNKLKQQLIDEKQEFEQLFKDKERCISELNSQICSLNDINQNKPKNLEQFVVREQELNARIDELTQKMDESNRVNADNELKNSETEYELEILKRNYSLEMESFGSQVTERESMIEKLQQKNDKLNRKLDKLDKLVKDHLDKEVYYKSKIDESQGLVKYEQMQRQSATDSRIFELQQLLEEKENSYGLEVMNLKADKSNLMALEAELRRKIRLLEADRSSDSSANIQFEREINNYRQNIESLVTQLETEKLEKTRFQELFQNASIGQNSDQINQLMAQMEAERQQQIAQKQELELKCKKFAAKFKVKDREVNALEEKLRIAKEMASKNVNEEDLIDSNKQIEQLVKKVDELQSTASNLDSALQSERLKRRQLENEKKTFWSKSTDLSRNECSDTHSSSFSLLIDEGMGDKSSLSSAKRFISKQKLSLLRGPTNAKYKRIAIVFYLMLIHILLLKVCLF